MNQPDAQEQMQNVLPEELGLYHNVLRNMLEVLDACGSFLEELSSFYAYLQSFSEYHQ